MHSTHANISMVRDHELVPQHREVSRMQPYMGIRVQNPGKELEKVAEVTLDNASKQAITWGFGWRSPAVL